MKTVSSTVRVVEMQGSVTVIVKMSNEVVGAPSSVKALTSTVKVPSFRKPVLCKRSSVPTVIFFVAWLSSITMRFGFSGCVPVIVNW